MQYFSILDSAIAYSESCNGGRAIFVMSRKKLSKHNIG